MNDKQLNKIENRITEIELFLDNHRGYNWDEGLCLALFNERSELKFKIEKLANKYWDSLPKNMQEEIRVKVYNEESINNKLRS